MGSCPYDDGERRRLRMHLLRYADVHLPVLPSRAEIVALGTDLSVPRRLECLKKTSALDAAWTERSVPF